MKVERRTHERIDPALCGRPVELSDGRARVELETAPAMVVDDRGLVHGGFAFGLAAHAAMLAVNEPTVALASAQVKFVRPVVVGERMEAEAHVTRSEGKKRWVQAVVRRGADPVFEGELVCVVPDRHVLDR